MKILVESIVFNFTEKTWWTTAISLSNNPPAPLNSGLFFTVTALICSSSILKSNMLSSSVDESAPQQRPDIAVSAVLTQSEQLPKGTPVVRGYDFEDGKVDYDALFESFKTSGFQATNFGYAVDIINDMVSKRPFYN